MTWKNEASILLIYVAFHVAVCHARSLPKYRFSCSNVNPGDWCAVLTGQRLLQPITSYKHRVRWSEYKLFMLVTSERLVRARSNDSLVTTLTVKNAGFQSVNKLGFIVVTFRVNVSDGDSLPHDINVVIIIISQVSDAKHSRQACRFAHARSREFRTALCRAVLSLLHCTRRKTAIVVVNQTTARSDVRVLHYRRVMSEWQLRCAFNSRVYVDNSALSACC